MISSLQSLRGIFAIMIFPTHFKWEGKAMFDAGGDLGVAFFFVLSGFALSAGYQQKIPSEDFSVKRFMLRRIFKLYPLHLICLAAFLLLNPSYLGSHIPETLSNIMLIQTWIPSPEYYFSGNAVGWCLADFMFMYILFPTLSKRINHMAPPSRKQQSGIYPSYKSGGVIICICATYIAIIILTPPTLENAIIYVSPLSRIFDFTLGILIWQLRAGIQTFGLMVLRQSAAVKSIIEMSVILLLMLFILGYPVIPTRVALASYWWIPTAAIILIFSILDQNGGIVTRLLHSRFMIRFGNISFSFYMIHLLAIRATKIISLKIEPYFSLSLWPTLIITTTLTTAAAFAVSHFFEQPLSRFLNKRFLQAKQ